MSSSGKENDTIGDKMDGISYDEAIEKINIDNPKKKIYILISLIGTLGGFVWGYDAGIIGTTLIFVTPYFHLTTIEKAILVSGTIGFAAIAALIAGPIVDRMGRKFLLVIDGLIYSVFAILAALSFNAIFLIVTRVAIGFAIGADGAVATAYISELSPMKARGRLTIVQQLMIFAGFTTAFWSGYYLSFTADWRLMYALGAVPALILFALRIYLPESPRWLIIHNRTEDAKKAFRKLGIAIKENIIVPVEESTSIRKVIKDPVVKRALLIMLVIAFLNNATGINVILYYAPTIYKTIGLTGSAAILKTAISESLSVVAYGGSFFLIDKLGRRSLSLLGYIGMAVSMLVMLLGIHTLLSGNTYSAAIEIFIAMTLFLGFYHLGVGGVFWVLQGETMPTEIRGKGAGYLATSAYVGTVFSTFTFPLWSKAIGSFSFFALELILSVIAVVVVFLFLPETMKVPLDKVTELFRKKKSDER